mgnify:CR=1 FL=1
MEIIKKRIKLTVTAEYEINLNPALFAGRSVAEFLAEFSDREFEVRDIDDVVKYAAMMIIQMQHEADGIGKIAHVSDMRYKNAAVRYDEHSYDATAEIVE